MHPTIIRSRRGAAAGFTIIELLISMAIIVTIMGATMTAMAQAMRANESALLMTTMNSSLRTGMDLVIRDLLQVGSGLPPGHAILIPSGTGAQQINLPGPPGPTALSAVGQVELDAIIPGPGLGPIVGGVATDTITTVAADSTFNDISLTARAADGTSITVNPAVNIASGPDRVVAGQLIMLEKGAYAVLLQVTGIDAAAKKILFAANDSLNLNQHTAPEGSTGKPCSGSNCTVATGLTRFEPRPDIALPSPQTVPATPFLNTTATRVRMISYYIDNSNAAHPRLVRRINNGSAVDFSNTSGTTVAFDIDKLQISYDLADGVNNTSNVRFTAADFGVGGACKPEACSVNQIRKVNVLIGARSPRVFSPTSQYLRNVLTTQISLRGMSFVNEYTPPVVP